MALSSFVWPLFLKLHGLVENIVRSTLTTLIYLCVALTIAHFFGWIERYIWWALEKEASKALNDGTITLGSFVIDWTEILQGKITLHASNVVVHTKEREAWQWESPLIARVGRASVECNAPITIFHLVFFRRELPVEVYSLKASDIQVFVERRDQVFNVYLFDKSLLLPPPPPRGELIRPVSSDSTDGSSDSIDLATETQNNNNSSHDSTTSFLDNSTRSCSTPPPTMKSTADKDHKKRAKLLVSEMLTAVETLGRAAQKGSLQSTIKQQGLELADRLRNKSLANKHSLNESVQVMKHVGKVAVESLSQVAPKHIMPQRRLDRIPKPVYGRVGRIVIQNLRIFTKYSWIKMEDKEGDVGGGWNKPIYIELMVVRASELCPPMSLKDADGMPAVYQTLDKVIEVAWKRLLAEMAKSNGGRLFQSALGEVLSFMKPNTTTSTASTSSSTHTATASTTTTTGSNSKTKATNGTGTTSSGGVAKASAAAKSTTRTSNKNVSREVRV